MFKIFHIDVDSVTIDDNVIRKPSYLSYSEWSSFWESTRETVMEDQWDRDNYYSIDEVEEKIEEAVNEREKELKIEFNDRLNRLYDLSMDSQTDFKSLFDDVEYKINADDSV